MNCKTCGKPIEKVGDYWMHKDIQPRHIAIPEFSSEEVSILPCPFEHPFDKGKTGIMYEQLGTINAYQVLCSCSAKGPVGTTPEEAVRRWNTAVRR